VSDAGKSRWTATCHVCDELTRKPGSTANVLAVPVAGPTNPLASVSGLLVLLATLSAVDSGGCCASSSAIDWYTLVLR
jgi:hypothetical protein